MPRALPLAVLLVVLTGVVLANGAIIKEGNILRNVIDDGRSKTIGYLSLPVHVAYVSASVTNSTRLPEPEGGQVNGQNHPDLHASPCTMLHLHFVSHFSRGRKQKSYT